MPRPRRNPDAAVTSSDARRARQQALRDAGGWIGQVELSADAYAALRALQGDKTVNETISRALLARR